MENLTANQESILLKGLGSNLLQLNRPTIKEANKMLKDWGLEIIDVKAVSAALVSNNNEYTGQEVYACIQLTALLTESNYKFDNHDVVFYIYKYKNVTEALTMFITDKNLDTNFATKEGFEKFDSEITGKKSPQFGEFVLSFDEAKKYLEKNPLGKITYESNINGAYISISKTDSNYLQLEDFGGVIKDRWLHRNLLNKQPLVDGYLCFEKWAIVA